jgi:hypothetical protein
LSPVAAKPEAAGTSRRWVLAAAAFAALIMVAGFAVFQSERRSPPESGDHAARAMPPAPGPADTRGRLDEANDAGGDGGNPR